MLVHKCQTREHLNHDVPYFIFSEHLVFSDGRAFHAHKKGEKRKGSVEERNKKNPKNTPPTGCARLFKMNSEFDFFHHTYQFRLWC